MILDPRFALPSSGPLRIGKPEWAALRFWRHLHPRIAARLVVELAKLTVGRGSGGAS